MGDCALLFLSHTFYLPYGTYRKNILRFYRYNSPSRTHSPSGYTPRLPSLHLALRTRQAHVADVSRTRLGVD